MRDRDMPPIEPDPEPDTTDAAEPDDVDSDLDAEDAPAMIDEHGDILGEGEKS